MTRIFIDMDGTLAKWTPSATPEQLLEPGFFINMPPEINVVQMANLLVRKEESNDIQVYILSAVMQENKLAVPEKNDWLDEYVDVAPERRIFVPCGENKAEYLPGGKQNGSLLYTLLPIQFSIQQFYEQKLAKLDAECEQERIRKRLEAFQLAQQETARPPA